MQGEWPLPSPVPRSGYKTPILGTDAEGALRHAPDRSVSGSDSQNHETES